MKRILSTILIALFSLISTSYAQIDLEKADGKTLIHMLKFIRSPEYSDAVPAILPLLRNASENVVRDTCRTLAVIGKTNAIPAIELLLKDKRVKVRVDAENALKVLRGEGGNTFPGTPLLVSLNGDPGYALQTLKLIRRPEFAAAVRS
ncbi:MAG: HEAT repeat domain-containing protein, partial [Limisphaerales bacterium]